MMMTSSMAKPLRRLAAEAARARSTMPTDCQRFQPRAIAPASFMVSRARPPCGCLRQRQELPACLDVEKRRPVARERGGSIGAAPQRFERAPGDINAAGAFHALLDRQLISKAATAASVHQAERTVL